MRILIDLLHPAHVHFFRPFREVMRARGHEVDVAARQKEMTTDLLERYGIDHTVLSRRGRGKARLGLEFVVRTVRLIHLGRRLRPDVMTGVMGPSIALAGRILGVPAAVFYDTEHARQTNLFVYPLAHTVCTPDCYEASVRGRHVTYPGYHELAYLHPRRFTPDPSGLRPFGLTEGEPYFLVRFVSWQAVHDIRQQRLSLRTKLRIVETLEERGRVVISSEGALPDALEEKRLRGPVEQVHQVIAHATGVVGESATMCSEAAVLGVPSVYLNPLRLGYLREQERRYGLVRCVHPENPDEVLHAIEALPWEGTERARHRLLDDKADVTAWMMEFFEKGFGKRSHPVGAPGERSR